MIRFCFCIEDIKAFSGVNEMGIEVQLEPLDETKANEVINPNFIYEN